jgi:hypothetical protein
MRGIAAGRKPAFETCREQGWEPGDVLASDAWAEPKKIVSITKTSVVLRAGKGRHQLRALPADVHRIEG